jgi:hypothetical protein
MKTYNHKLISTILIIFSLLFTSCEELWNPDNCIEGNGDRGTETRALESFERIVVNGSFDVRIDTGYESSAAIEADENLIDLIVTHVSGNKLIIETRDGICVQPSRPMEVVVTTNKLNELTLNGSGVVYCHELDAEEISVNLNGSGIMEFDDLLAAHVDIDLAGSGQINIDVLTESIATRLEGSGEIKLYGECISGDFEIVGSGKIKAGQLASEVCTVHISGSGIADTRVSGALDVTIIGSGIVYYTGNPTIESYISGSGDIIER